MPAQCRILFLLTVEGKVVILKGTGRMTRAVQGNSVFPKAKDPIQIRPLQLAKTCKQLALDKKGEGVLILDLRGLSSVTDFFVMCHGTSRRHVQAIAENIRVGLKKRKVSEAHIEGVSEGRWIVLDYIDAIVHVFDQEMRDTYRLEDLWGDAARVE
jgi:ribosome-associated protein